MTALYYASIEVLSEIVGPVPAELCVVAASANAGKNPEELNNDDYDAIARTIRSDLSRFVSPELIQLALDEIHGRLNAPAEQNGLGDALGGLPF